MSRNIFTITWTLAPQQTPEPIPHQGVSARLDATKLGHFLAREWVVRSVGRPSLTLSVLSFGRSVPPAEAAPSQPKVAWSPCYKEFGLPVRVRYRAGSAGSRRVGRAGDLDRHGALAGRRPGPAHRVDLPQPGRAGRIRSEPACSSALRSCRGARDSTSWVSTRVSGAARPCAASATLRQWRLLHTVRLPDHGRGGSTGSRPTASWPASASTRHPVIDHMSTADVARDLDLLRCAWGMSDSLRRLSYGSYLGARTPTSSPTDSGRW